MDMALKWVAEKQHQITTQRKGLSRNGGKTQWGLIDSTNSSGASRLRKESEDASFNQEKG